MVMMKSFLTSVIFGLLLCAISNAAAAQLPLPSQTTYYALPIPSISAEQHALNMLNEAVTETKALPINDNNSNSNSNSNSGISGYISPKPAFVAKMSQVPERYRYGKNKPPMNATETEEDKLPMNATETEERSIPIIAEGDEMEMMESHEPEPMLSEEPMITEEPMISEIPMISEEPLSIEDKDKDMDMEPHVDIHMGPSGPLEPPMSEPKEVELPPIPEVVTPTHTPPCPHAVPVPSVAAVPKDMPLTDIEEPSPDVMEAPSVEPLMISVEPSPDMMDMMAVEHSVEPMMISVEPSPDMVMMEGPSEEPEPSIESKAIHMPMDMPVVVPIKTPKPVKTPHCPPGGHPAPVPVPPSEPIEPIEPMVMVSDEPEVSLEPSEEPVVESMEPAEESAVPLVTTDPEIPVDTGTPKKEDKTVPPPLPPIFPVPKDSSKNPLCSIEVQRYIEAHCGTPDPHSSHHHHHHHHHHTAEGVESMLHMMD